MSDSTNPNGSRDVAKSPSRQQIFVVSDATGNTGEKMVRAALLQFRMYPARLRIWPCIRTFEEVEQVVEAAERGSALIVYTMVNARLRDHIYKLSTEHDIESVDLMGALLGKLSMFLDAEPEQTPGLLHRMDDTYYRRIEAMEFAVKHDDGKVPWSLQKADIVLVGVSRTSKTPVATFLAGKGYKVANVPLVNGVDPPDELFALPPGRVFALTIDPQKLQQIRHSRLIHLGVEKGGEYADKSHVFNEVRWALNLFRTRTSWPIIDVTTRAVEETAAEVMRLHEELTRVGEPSPDED